MYSNQNEAKSAVESSAPFLFLNSEYYTQEITQPLKLWRL